MKKKDLTKVGGGQEQVMQGKYDQNTLCTHMKMYGHVMKPIRMHS